MRTRLLLLVAALAAILPGCALAPLSSHVTARTNGRGQSLASVGSTIGTSRSGWLPSFKYSLGLADDLDLGFQYEVIEWGVWGKYAFVNPVGDGFSFAMLAGVGAGYTGFYGYAGPIVSYKLGWFEPYLTTRFNYVSFGLSDIQVATVGEFNVLPGVYRYFQHTAGFMAWPIDWWGLGLEVSSISTVGSPFILEDKSRLLLSGNFSFRF